VPSSPPPARTDWRSWGSAKLRRPGCAKGSLRTSHVYVGITGEHIYATNNRGVVAVTGDQREVVAADVKRVVDASKIINLAAERQIVHALPRHFTIDGQDGVTDPVGMSGGRLEVDTHIITGGSSFIANVLKCEEKHVGCVLLDVGGGTTDIAVFASGGVVHTATIPVGGNILTNDIALGLKTTFAEAENIKRTYGSGILHGDEHEQMFQVKALDGRTTREVSSSELRAIVVPRVLEIFRLAKANIVERLAREHVLSEVVITGGVAHLRGIETVASEVFGLPVRIGVPSTIAGLTESVKQPQYATAVGLVLFGPRGEAAPHLNGHAAGGPMAKFWSWFTSIWN
jgi:cell division protein FtsA